MKSDILNGFFSLRREIEDYFGRDGKWEAFRIDDQRELYWMVVEGTKPMVVYSENPITIDSIAKGDVYIGSIYPTSILAEKCRTTCRREDLVAVPVETGMDGGRFLMMFSSKNEVSIQNHEAIMAIARVS